MSAPKIKKLMIEYQSWYDEYGHAECELRSRYKNLSEEEKEDLEETIDYAEYNMQEIACEIKKLNPSKYMLNTYLELQDIIEEAI